MPFTEEDISAQSDAQKLRLLADWHDAHDDKNGYTGAREVQADLRRIADTIENGL